MTRKGSEVRVLYGPPLKSAIGGQVRLRGADRAQALVTAPPLPLTRWPGGSVLSCRGMRCGVGAAALCRSSSAADAGRSGAAVSAYAAGSATSPFGPVFARVASSPAVAAGGADSATEPLWANVDAAWASVVMPTREVRTGRRDPGTEPARRPVACAVVTGCTGRSRFRWRRPRRQPPR